MTIGKLFSRVQFGKKIMEKDGFAAGMTNVLISLTATTWKERANAKAILQEMEELVNLVSFIN